MAQSSFAAYIAAQQSNAAAGLDAPLAGISNQYTYSSFIYPLDLGAPGAGKDHYMVFHINETSNTSYQTVTAGGGTAPAPTDMATINANNIGNPNSVINSQPIKRVATTIVLYIPQYESHYAANWSEEDVGVAGTLAGIATGKQTASESMVELITSFGASVAKNLGTAMNELTDMNLSSAISLASRMAINPHQEVIFQGIGFRTFQFNFRFTAQSEPEALNIDNIIRAFKFYSAPEVKANTFGRFWVYPGEFDIQFYSNGVENQFVNKISTCALTNMSVNYTSAGEWAAHRPHTSGLGSLSVCTDISLTFKELEIMTKQRILEGY